MLPIQGRPQKPAGVPATLCCHKTPLISLVTC